VPNLKFISLVILELIAFNAQNFTGSHDPGHVPFSKKNFRAHNRTFPESKYAKFKVHTFSHLVI